MISQRSDEATSEKPKHSWRFPHAGSFLAALILFKLAYIAIIWLTNLLIPIQYATGNYSLDSVYHLDQNNLSLSNVMLWQFIPWDAGHYIHLSITGYTHPGRGDRAFYPLWPGIIWLFTKLTHGNPVVVAEVLANLLAVAAVYCIHLFVHEKYGETVARRVTILVLAFPGAIFLALPFSEPVFLLLSAAAFLMLFRDVPWAAGIAGFLAALTRPTGILWAVPIAVDLIGKKRYRDLWTALLPVAGFAAYLIIMQVTTGSPWSGFQAQNQFAANVSVGGLFNLTGFFHALFTKPDIGNLVAPLTSPFDRLWFILGIPLLVKLYKGDKAAFCYTVLMMIVPAMTAKFMSFTRYMVAAFPLFIAGAQWPEKSGREYLFTAVVAVLFILQIIFLLRQINFVWVG